jgi:hypothetical protein
MGGEDRALAGTCHEQNTLMFVSTSCSHTFGGGGLGGEGADNGVDEMDGMPAGAVLIKFRSTLFVSVLPSASESIFKRLRHEHSGRENGGAVIDLLALGHMLLCTWQLMELGEAPSLRVVLCSSAESRLSCLMVSCRAAFRLSFRSQRSSFGMRLLSISSFSPLRLFLESFAISPAGRFFRTPHCRSRS